LAIVPVLTIVAPSVALNALGVETALEVNPVADGRKLADVIW